jgi:hypothetical protein
MASLHFITGPLAGKRARLKGARISIGRDAGNNIRIDDDSIAPRHLVLVRDEDQYALYIDSSKPPVAINGKQIVNETLKDGDLLQIGMVRAKFTNAAAARVAKTPVYNPLDFFADPPPTIPDDNLNFKREPEILSLDDAEQLPLEDSVPRHRTKSKRRVLLAVIMLISMLAGSLLLFRKELWKAPSAPSAVSTSNPTEGEKPPPSENPDPANEPVVENPLDGSLGPLAIGIGPSGLHEKGKIHRTRSFKSHQAAIDLAQPGDSVIFDSVDPKPIVVLKPMRDVQFISGSATWEIHADLIDCQFIFHEMKQFNQLAGKLERGVFFRCPMKQTRLIHADAVSFYFDERSSLHPKDNPQNGRSPALLLSGFVRDVLIMKPFSGLPALDKRFDMRWAPSIRIDATDPVGDGRGTYILSPVVLGQRAWTPHEITRGNGITYAHLTSDGNAWADPVLNIIHGNDCVVLGNSFGSELPTTVEQYALPPKKLKYHDRDEFGHDNGPAFRGAAMTIVGQNNRIVAHGDARKPWTVGRKIGIPGLHYADGIVASDPSIKQFATDHGGLSANFAEMKSVFVSQPGAEGGECLSCPEQAEGGPLYPKRGPALHKPVFVPLKDLRINAGEFDKHLLLDMTGKPPAEIEKALLGDKSIFLGPGTYELKQTLRAGFVVGAGIESTIVKWPETVDCAQRNCRGLINCTMSGGKFGYNSQAGIGGRVNNPGGLFVRTRFSSQKEAGVNLHTSVFQTWQDCEFAGCKDGFANGLDKSPGLYKGDKGVAGGVSIDSLNICNCTFSEIKHRAIDLTPDAPNLGHVGIHNCSFDTIGDEAIRIEGGQTHLIQLCRLQYCARQTYAPALSAASNGTVALSHIQIDSTGVKGNPLCVSLKGLAAVSHCTIKGLATSLKCDGLLAADFVVGDGNLQANKNSLLCGCRFKNMNLPDGVAIAKEKDFADVTAMTLPALIDKTPPSVVEGLKSSVKNGLRHLEWKPAEDPESGIAGYIIMAGGKEIGRAEFQYEPPSDFHSPVLKIPAPLSFIDSNGANKNDEVLAINGAGLMSDGKEAPLRRLGPARARFLNKNGESIGFKDFVALKGKVTEIITEEGSKLPIPKVGIKGMPNAIFFEMGELVEVP